MSRAPFTTSDLNASSTRPGHRELAFAAFVFALAAVVFARAVTFGFVNLDDPLYVSANDVVRQGLGLSSLSWAWTTFHGGFYIPITWMSYLVDTSVFGQSAWGYHLTNVLLHACNSALLYIFFRLATHAPWRSLALAALFAVHPLRVESIVWVTERKDVLALFFCLLSMIAYIDYGKSRRLSAYLAALILFAMSLLAKPLADTLPFLLLLLDYWPLKRFDFGQEGRKERPRRPRIVSILLEKIPFAALAVAIGVLTYVAYHHVADYPPAGSLSIFTRCENAALSYVRYLIHMAWFSDLAVFYPYPDQFPPLLVVAALSVLLAITAFAIWQLHNRPWLIVGWLWFLGGMLPTLGIVRAGDQSMADRFMYLPSIGILLMLVWSIPSPDMPRSRLSIAARIGLGAIVVVLVSFTLRQISYWRDDRALFEHAAQVTDRNYVAYGQLGTLAMQQGNLPLAIAYFQQALAANPGDERADINLGILRAKQGDLMGAERHFRAAIRANETADAHYDLGILLLRRGDSGGAKEEFRRALQLQPDYEKASHALEVAEQTARSGVNSPSSAATSTGRFSSEYLLARQAEQQGDLPAAEKHYRRALESNPGDANVHADFASLLAQTGRVPDAITECRAAISLQPENADVFYNLGVLLMQSGQSKQAADALKESLRLRPNDEQAISALKHLEHDPG